MSGDILEQVYLGNKVLDFIVALGILLLGIIIVKIVKFAVLGRLKKLAEKTANTLDDFLVSVASKVGLPLLYLSALYISIGVLNVAEDFQRVVNYVFL
ncbi:MAG: hypothetical protein PHQ54_05295, partial [Candidatus Omnitrophica bacterium]|nr:hypothetical protein [Candidatus Omnitrophota bacterium]